MPPRQHRGLQTLELNEAAFSSGSTNADIITAGRFCAGLTGLLGMGTLTVASAESSGPDGAARYKIEFIVSQFRMFRVLDFKHWLAPFCDVRSKQAVALPSVTEIIVLGRAFSSRVGSA
jgi:hypothetical protein